MYTLRRISSRGVEMNHFLGKSYTLVTLEKSRDEFISNYRLLFQWEFDDTPKGSDNENIFALISNEDGSHVQPLYSNQQNYVMGSDGKTLSTIRP